jgi:hypothetical protein
MAVAGSTGMWITDTIRGMGIAVRRQRVAIGHSAISRAMRLGMGKGILGMPDIARLQNIALELSVAAAAVAGAAAGTRSRELFAARCPTHVEKHGWDISVLGGELAAHHLMR